MVADPLMRDLDLGSGHTAYRHVTLIDIYVKIPNIVENGKTL